MEKILIPVSSEVRLSNLEMLAQGMANVEQRQNKELSKMALVIGTTIVITLAVIAYFESALKTKEKDL